jgi:hypothetical protein
LDAKGEKSHDQWRYIYYIWGVNRWAARSYAMVLFGTFEVACLGDRSLKRALWWLEPLVIARARARCRKVSSANLGRGHEVRFDLAAQTAQVDHSVSSPELIEGVNRHGIRTPSSG